MKEHRTQIHMWLYLGGNFNDLEKLTVELRLTGSQSNARETFYEYQAPCCQFSTTDNRDHYQDFSTVPSKRYVLQEG